MILLNKFPCPSGGINILTKAASRYRMLGTILLNSPDGTEVQIIEQRHGKDPYNTTYDIFQKWLTSDEEASWKKLVQCLRDVELNVVAKDIEDYLH